VRSNLGKKDRIIEPEMVMSRDDAIEWVVLGSWDVRCTENEMRREKDRKQCKKERM